VVVSAVIDDGPGREETAVLAPSATFSGARAREPHLSATRHADDAKWGARGGAVGAEEQASFARERSFHEQLRCGAAPPELGSLLAAQRELVPGVPGVREAVTHDSDLSRVRLTKHVGVAVRRAAADRLN